MWMKLRTWWYSITKPENLPNDVREYEIRRYLKDLDKQKVPPEQAQKHSTELMAAALSLESGQINGTLRDELIATSMKMLDHVPSFCCNFCNLTHSIPRPAEISGKLYCDNCSTALNNMISSPEDVRSLLGEWCVEGSAVSEAIVRTSDFHACATIKQGVIRRWEWPSAAIANNSGEIFLNLNESRISTRNSREDMVQIDGFLLQSSMHIILRFRRQNRP